MKRLFFILGLLSSSLLTFAQDDATTITTDSVAPKKLSFFGKIAKRLSESNKPNEKKLDFLFLGAPSYSKTTGLMINLCGSGEYRWDRRDTLYQKSNFSLYASASTNGVLTLGVMGKNFLPQDRARLNYDLYVQKTKARTWGIGVEDGGDIDENEANFNRLQFKCEPEFIYRVAKNFYAGVTLNAERNNIYGLEKINPEWVRGLEELRPEAKALEILDEKGNMKNGQYFDHFIQVLGLGYTLNYDSRDFVLNASKGINIRWSMMFYPNFLVKGKMKYDDQIPEEMKGIAKTRGFTMYDFTFDFYHKLWKGAVLAYELHGRYNDGQDVPWVMLAEVGGNSRMRGYFQGRYRDKGILETQLELRQHIYGRSGVVAWVGAANIFPSFRSMRFKNTLGNYGIGYRFELKHLVNVRVDFGFTNKDFGIVFGVNEAF